MNPVPPNRNTIIGKSAQAPQRMWRKERWATWASYQVIWLCLNQATAPLPEDVYEVCNMGTPPGLGEHFSTDSAQRLIGQVMAWNGEIDLMRNLLDRMQQEMKNMIDVLGRI
ncbi:hypothetical protein AB205_0145770 [Aquarana catesbeiana]|uniref:Uncharacterized protein n=1 Tax=Aquarana catesbeiana TaxID=8400 RepID=A0A2G9QC55_AQUCT|nr:hypothetical protein AB205_0145770 [Aquarana catesbeiana]